MIAVNVMQELDTDTPPGSSACHQEPDTLYIPGIVIVFGHLAEQMGIHISHRERMIRRVSQ